MKFKTVVLCLKFFFAINHEQLTFFYKYDVIIDIMKVTLTVFQRTCVQSAEITRFLKDSVFFGLRVISRGHTGKVRPGTSTGGTP